MGRFLGSKTVLSVFLTGFLLTASPGCSWIGMTTVPGEYHPGQKLECSGWSWPIIDASFTALFSVISYEISDFGVGFLTAIPVIITLLYAGSSGTGFYWANQCHQAKKSRVELLSDTSAVPADRDGKTRSKLPVWARTKAPPVHGPRRVPVSVPSEYRRYCEYEAGTRVQLETRTRAAEVKFLKCTSIGVEVERKDKEVGVIAFSRIWKMSRAAPAAMKVPAQPATVLQPKEPAPPSPPPAAEPVVEAPPPPVQDVEVEAEADTGHATSGAFVLNNVKVFWGMGVALDASDPYSARRRSDRRARTEIFKLLKNNLDAFAGMAPEDIQMRLELLEKAAVKKTTIIDRWINNDEDSCTSVAVLPAAECGLNLIEANRLWGQISRGQSESR